MPSSPRAWVDFQTSRFSLQARTLHKENARPRGHTGFHHAPCDPPVCTFQVSRSLTCARDPIPTDPPPRKPSETFPVLPASSLPTLGRKPKDPCVKIQSNPQRWADDSPEPGLPLQVCGACSQRVPPSILRLQKRRRTAFEGRWLLSLRPATLGRWPGPPAPRSRHRDLSKARSAWDALAPGRSLCRLGPG